MGTSTRKWCMWTHMRRSLYEAFRQHSNIPNLTVCICNIPNTKSIVWLDKMLVSRKHFNTTQGVPSDFIIEKGQPQGNVTFAPFECVTCLWGDILERRGVQVSQTPSYPSLTVSCPSIQEGLEFARMMRAYACVRQWEMVDSLDAIFQLDVCKMTD